jgi:hypothetical protein
VLRETTSRGLCGLGCPSRTSERGGEGDCVKEGGGGEGKCERERALERLRYYMFMCDYVHHALFIAAVNYYCSKLLLLRSAKGRGFYLITVFLGVSP